MGNDSVKICDELREHLESFRHQETLPKVPVTMTGVPREGLTIMYQHPSAGPADPSEIVGEAAKVVGAAGIGTASGAAVGAIIGKVVLGGTLARIGVASAGAAIGIPILAPVALVGGAVATAAYAAYKMGQGKRDHELAGSLLTRLIEHMREFAPTGEWPEIEMYVSAPGSGLAATWQPEVGNEESKSSE